MNELQRINGNPKEEVKDSREPYGLEWWHILVTNNATNSYGCIINTMILLCWECKCQNREEIEKILHDNSCGLTGYQAEMIIGFVLKYKPDFEVGKGDLK